MWWLKLLSEIFGYDLVMVKCLTIWKPKRVHYIRSEAYIKSIIGYSLLQKGGNIDGDAEFHVWKPISKKLFKIFIEG